LRDAGILVDEGLLSEEAARANRVFYHAMDWNRPYVIAKVGASLDGKIALPSGESKWITSPRARREGHRLRAECGAVLVGRKTVESDDPRLTARLPDVVNQPLRVVLDPSNRLKGSYRVFSNEAETWHITGKIDLHDLLARLMEAGHIGLLVEGGGLTIGHFMTEDLIDELRLFVAPKVFGAGAGWVSNYEIPKLSEARPFRFERPRLVGVDTELSAIRIRQ
jgi:diaminohydroxyphosphoribosylaminopyrimidine deaminase/5-amino-6-(5-phosphoribosylamino)uracil reductase